MARRAEKLNELAEKLISDFNISVDVLQADLSEPTATSDLKDEITRRNLTVDFLINNAGSAGPDLLDDRDWPAQQKYIELMMTSVAGLCHHFIPDMRERGFGRVVNIASVAGHLSVRGDTSYGPTKAYLIALSKNLAATLQGTDVNVLALCPGFTHTDFHESPRLAEMKRSTPGFIWYDAEVIVREGLRALEKGKSVYISGRLYRYAVPILRTRIADWILARVGIKRDY